MFIYATHGIVLAHFLIQLYLQDFVGRTHSSSFPRLETPAQNRPKKSSQRRRQNLLRLFLQGGRKKEQKMKKKGARKTLLPFSSVGHDWNDLFSASSSLFFRVLLSLSFSFISPLLAIPLLSEISQAKICHQEEMEQSSME